MTHFQTDTIPIDDAPRYVEELSKNWLWHGYLHPGDVTLLTSPWKTGKTTLLTGLLRRLQTGGTFLDQALRPGRALIVSEESRAQWAERVRQTPIGQHVQLLSRPFRGRPNPDEWNELVDHALESRQHSGLDLFVVDPLASFLPGRCESDAATLLEMLQPLHRLAVEGVAVLLLHHPRKKPSEPGASARGSGALLGFVDIILELNAFGRLKTDLCRRQIIALSRKPDTPARLAFDWNPHTGEFTSLGDPFTVQFEENWNQVLAILKKRRVAATHHELLSDWPPDQENPSPSALYRWLNQAHANNRVGREGNGTKGDPWRYRLKIKNDAYDDLPPLKPLIGMGVNED